MEYECAREAGGRQLVRGTPWSLRVTEVRRGAGEGK